jgi:hypothetical protein
MKLTIKNSQLSVGPEQFLRRAGYGYIEDRRRGTTSFVRRLGSGFYPRLHMYLERENGDVSFNLHLDQKQASYAGARAHNAEYGGPIVEWEMERIKNLVSQGMSAGASRNPGEAVKPEYDKKEEGWWRKIFK